MPLECLALEGGRLVGGGFTIGGKCLLFVLVRLPGRLEGAGSGHADAEDLGARVCGPQHRAVLAQPELGAADGAEIARGVGAVPVAAAQVRVRPDDPAGERLGRDGAGADVLQDLLGQRRVAVAGAGEQAALFGADVDGDADRHGEPLAGAAVQGHAVVVENLHRPGEPAAGAGGVGDDLVERGPVDRLQVVALVVGDLGGVVEDGGERLDGAAVAPVRTAEDVDVLERVQAHVLGLAHTARAAFPACFRGDLRELGLAEFLPPDVGGERAGVRGSLGCQR